MLLIEVIEEHLNRLIFKDINLNIRSNIVYLFSGNSWNGPFFYKGEKRPCIVQTLISIELFSNTPEKAAAESK